MATDRPSESDVPNEHGDRSPYMDLAEGPDAQEPQKDWLEDARRVYGPIGETTPTWHGRDAEGRDISGAGRPSLSPEEVDAHHLAEAAREAAQIREGIKAGVRYGDDTLEWVAKVEAEASAVQPPGTGNEKPSPKALGGTSEAHQLDDGDQPGAVERAQEAADELPVGMPVDEDGRPAFRTDAYAQWYRESHDTGDAPAPYEMQWDEQLPEWRKGAKVEGFLIRTDNDQSLMGDRPFTSGYEGPAKSFHPEELGLDKAWLNLSHFETHAAATMRLRSDETSEATMYLNRRPCSGEKGCYENMDRMLPEAAKVTAYWPDGYGVFIGRPDEPRNKE